jgi:putative intracellular protease/amidase
MKQRILIAMTSHDTLGSTGRRTGAYLTEISHPHAVFEAAGLGVDFASVRGGAVPLDPSSLDRKDPVNAAFQDDQQLMRRLTDTPASASVDVSRYAAIFFAGGFGAMWDLAEDDAFARAAARIYEAGGVVGAVCHGPAGLVNVRLSDGSYLVAGKALTAFTNDEERAMQTDRTVPFLLEDRLIERGARFEPAPLWQRQVVVSERLVTGQNPASAAGVAERMAALLGAA